MGAYMSGLGGLNTTKGFGHQFNKFFGLGGASKGTGASFFKMPLNVSSGGKGLWNKATGTTLNIGTKPILGGGHGLKNIWNLGPKQILKTGVKGAQLPAKVLGKGMSLISDPTKAGAWSRIGQFGNFLQKPGWQAGLTRLGVGGLLGYGAKKIYDKQSKDFYRSQKKKYSYLD